MKSFSKSTILGLTLGVFLAAYAVFAFNPPTAIPPAGNVNAPLNTGPDGQEKSGGLILNTGGAQYGLIVDKGFVGIGTLIPSDVLHILSDRPAIRLQSPVTASQAIFNFTGTEQTFVVPLSVNSITVDAVGASGGAGGPGCQAGSPGGRGGRVQTNLSVTPGNTLRIYVGGQGGTNEPRGIGGFNGGAWGLISIYTSIYRTSIYRNI